MVEVTCTPTELPMNLKPWMVTVAWPSPAVVSTLPATSKPYWFLTPLVMTVPPPEPDPTMVSSLLMVAPAKVPGPTMMVSPATAASTAAWIDMPVTT